MKENVAETHPKTCLPLPSLEINNKRLPSVPCWDCLESTKFIQYINLFHNLNSIVATKEDHLIHSLAITNNS